VATFVSALLTPTPTSASDTMTAQREMLNEGRRMIAE